MHILSHLCGDVFCLIFFRFNVTLQCCGAVNCMPGSTSARRSPASTTILKSSLFSRLTTSNLAGWTKIESANSSSINYITVVSYITECIYHCLSSLFSIILALDYDSFHFCYHLWYSVSLAKQKSNREISTIPTWLVNCSTSVSILYRAKSVVCFSLLSENISSQQRI